MSFYVVEYTTLVLYLELSVFLLINLRVLIDVIAGRCVLEPQLTFSSGHSFVYFLIFMDILQVRHWE